MKLFLALAAFAAAMPAHAATTPAANQLEVGTKAIHSFAGCYMVDFNYTETKALKEGYKRDERVYNVNSDKTVKEWVYVNDISPTEFRVQHVLFMTKLDGTVVKETIMKHTGDEWRFDAPYRYDFVSPSKWDVVREGTQGLWSRRITNLDDGLRYGCSAAFSNEGYPSWGCNSYAPIPGRETRDMGRHDYNTVERFNKVVAYGNSWLEREYNTKIDDKNGIRTKVAEEEGRNFWIRLPDSDCADAQNYVKERKAFWDLNREVWAETLDGSGSFGEQGYAPNKPTRYGAFLELENEYASQDLGNPAIRAKAKDALKAVIAKFRTL